MLLGGSEIRGAGWMMTMKQWWMDDHWSEMLWVSVARDCSRLARYNMGWQKIADPVVEPFEVTNLTWLVKILLCLHLQVEWHIQYVKSLNFKVNSYCGLIVSVKNAVAKSVNSRDFFCITWFTTNSIRQPLSGQV